MSHFLQVLLYFFRTVLFSVFSGLHPARLDDLQMKVIPQKFTTKNHLHGTNYLESITSETHMEPRVHLGASLNPPLRTADMASLHSLQSPDTHLQEQDIYFAQTRTIFPFEYGDFPGEWSDEFSDCDEEDGDSSYFTLNASPSFIYDSDSEYHGSWDVSPADSTWADSVINIPSPGLTDFEQPDVFSYPPPPGSMDGKVSNNDDIEKDAGNRPGTNVGNAGMTPRGQIDDQVVWARESQDSLGVQ